MRPGLSSSTSPSYVTYTPRLIITSLSGTSVGQRRLDIPKTNIYSDMFILQLAQMHLCKFTFLCLSEASIWMKQNKIFQGARMRENKKKMRLQLTNIESIVNVHFDRRRWCRRRYRWTVHWEGNLSCLPENNRFRFISHLKFINFDHNNN